MYLDCPDKLNLVLMKDDERNSEFKHAAMVIARMDQTDGGILLSAPTVDGETRGKGLIWFKI